MSLRSGLLPRATNRVLHFTRSASPSVVPSPRALSAAVRRACLGALFRAHRCRTAGSAPTSLSRSARDRFRARARAAAHRRPRPRPPRLRERAVACSTRDAFHRRETLLGLGSGPTTLPPWSVAWHRFARRGRPLRARRPSTRPAATGPAFERQMPLADFCNCKEYEHTSERPIPASIRARERLVSLRPVSCPTKREQAARHTEPKPRRRRSAAASTESTSSQRPHCGG
jgi:hypothetical protein